MPCLALSNVRHHEIDVCKCRASNEHRNESSTLVLCLCNSNKTDPWMCKNKERIQRVFNGYREVAEQEIWRAGDVQALPGSHLSSTSAWTTPTRSSVCFYASEDCIQKHPMFFRDEPIIKKNQKIRLSQRGINKRSSWLSKHSGHPPTALTRSSSLSLSMQSRKLTLPSKATIADSLSTLSG